MKLHIYMASFGPQSQKFLDLAARSLEAQTFQDFDVTLVSSGEFVPTFPKKYAHYHSDDHLHFPAAINHAHEKSKHKDYDLIMLLNDDTILSATCIEEVVKTVEMSDVIASPMSSCMNGRFYQAPLGFITADGKQVPYTKNQHSFEEIKDYVDDIIYRSAIHSPKFWYVHHVCFFATIMRRTTFEKLGGLDQTFLSGFDDEDACIRARKFGVLSGIVTNAFVFHFSGATASDVLTQEDRDFNLNYFKQKHNL